MNIEEYNDEVARIKVDIDKIVDQMIVKFEEQLEKNRSTISSLIYDEEFLFINRDGKQIKMLDERYLEIQDGVFFSQFASNKRYFGLKYSDPDAGDLFDSLSDDFTRKAFHDPEFYKDVMHIVGLEGVLNAALADSRGNLNSLEELDFN
ncbi:MAG: hypothetical protein LBT37_07990 [Lactobacillaceae bacterium]|jgi:hypothetical protein|nr:hypothetical protein [Lactobacillaceae bacterium]